MDIRVDFEEAYRYLGCTGAPDGEALAELRRAAALVLEAARPKHIEKICAVAHGETPILAGTSFALPGRAAAELLRECSECCLFSSADPFLVRVSLLEGE